MGIQRDSAGVLDTLQYWELIARLQADQAV